MATTTVSFRYHCPNPAKHELVSLQYAYEIPSLFIVDGALVTPFMQSIQRMKHGDDVTNACPKSCETPGCKNEPVKIIFKSLQEHDSAANALSINTAVYRICDSSNCEAYVQQLAEKKVTEFVHLLKHGTGPYTHRNSTAKVSFFCRTSSENKTLVYEHDILTSCIDMDKKLTGADNLQWLVGNHRKAVMEACQRSCMAPGCSRRPTYLDVDVHQAYDPVTDVLYVDVGAVPACDRVQCHLYVSSAASRSATPFPARPSSS